MVGSSGGGGGGALELGFAHCGGGGAMWWFLAREISLREEKIASLGMYGTCVHYSIIKKKIMKGCACQKKSNPS